MRRNLSLIFVLLIAIATATIWLDYRATPKKVTIAPESLETSKTPQRPAPDFTFTDLHGDAGNLNELKGKIVILHFWASWCPPCVEELPGLLKTAKEMNREMNGDVVLLAVSSDKSAADIAKFMKLHRLEAPKGGNIHVVWDKDRAITHDLYQTFAYPETILITPDGLMARKLPGNADWGSPAMKSLLRSLADTPPIP